MNLAFVNAQVYTPFYSSDTVVLTHNSNIYKLVSTAEYQNSIKATGDYQEIDCKGLNLSPGFIDLQVNGCGGVNFSESTENLSEQTLMTIHQCNLKHGCTTFLPTLITNPLELRRHALEMVKDLLNRRPELKTSIPGIHIEGPHISIAKKGTHNPKFIKPITQEDLDVYLEFKDYICMLTLAPEENDLELVKPMIDAGILISIGHTNATYDQAKAYIDAGVKTATHLYNAMSPTSNGRTPGVVGAIYTHNNIAPGLITDGIHIDWSLVNLSLQVKQDQIFVVTDAVAPAGTDMTEFVFANKVIKVINESCFDEFGSLSGSAITMDSACRRLLHNTPLNHEQILKLVTYNPARQISSLDKIGQLKEGLVANLTVFDDEFNIQSTYVNGELAYSK